jgi:hypothetical protein
MRMLKMAMINSNFAEHTHFPFKDPDVNTTYEEFAVGGKMLIANYTSTETDKVAFASVDSWQNFVKDKLAVEIGRALIREKLVSFTLQDDIVSGTTHYRARCFATPDTQVKILAMVSKR